MTLLYNEPPIAVSPTLAKELGLNAAVFLQQLHYWTEEKRKNPDLYRDSYQDGYFWVYKTVSEWVEQMPFLGSEKTFKRMITELQSKGIIVVENYNRLGFDKTNWYRINYLNLNQLMTHASGQNDPSIGSKCPDGKGQKDPSIGSKCPDGKGQKDPTNTIDYPETTTETTTNNTPHTPQGDVCAGDVCAQAEFSEFSDSQSGNATGQGKAKPEQADSVKTNPAVKQDCSAALPPGFAEFWAQYPAKIAKPAALRAWRKLKPSQELQAAILHDIAKRKASDRQWKRGFIPHPSTYLNQARWEDQMILKPEIMDDPREILRRSRERFYAKQAAMAQEVNNA